MPYKNFGNETLLAADVNRYLMRQSIIRVANQAELAAIPAPEVNMVAALDDRPGRLFVYTGTAWSQASLAETPVPLTYSAAWQAPTSRAPLEMYRSGGRVFLRGGTIENRQSVSLPTYGQTAAALTFPAEFRPTRMVAMPATADVSGQFMAAGMARVLVDGTITLQTTTAWNNVTAGNGMFCLPAVSWAVAD